MAHLGPELNNIAHHENILAMGGGFAEQFLETQPNKHTMLSALQKIKDGLDSDVDPELSADETTSFISIIAALAESDDIHFALPSFFTRLSQARLNGVGITLTKQEAKSYFQWTGDILLAKEIPVPKFVRVDDITSVDNTRRATPMLAMNKQIDEAFKSHHGINLSYVQVTYLTCFCRSIHLAPRTPTEVLHGFNEVHRKANEAQDNGEGLVLSASDVANYTTYTNRAILYRPSSMSPQEACTSWMNLYRIPGLNHTHCLDYKRDSNRDYSIYMCMSKDAFAERLQNMTCSEIEDYAEKIFFCEVACVEKLLLSKSSGEVATFNAEESWTLLNIRAHYDREHNVNRVATCRAGEKLYDATVNRADVAVLNSKEASNFLAYCEGIPIPKPDSMASTQRESSIPRDGLEAIPLYSNLLAESVSGSSSDIGSRDRNSHTKTLHDLDCFFTALVKYFPEIGKRSIADNLNTILEGVCNQALSYEITEKENMLYQSELADCMKALIDDSPAMSERLNTPIFHEGHCKGLRDAIKALIKARNEDVKHNMSLRKALNAKDKKIDEYEASLIQGRELKGVREEKLTNEVRLLQSQSDKLKRQLDAARNEPDKIKEQWGVKLQKLHDKNRELEKKLTAEVDAHKILRLDHEETLKQLNTHKGKLEQYKMKQREFKDETAKVVAERNSLRARVQTFELSRNQDAEQEAASRTKTLQEAEVRNTQLQEDLDRLNHDRIIDERNIRELSSQNEELKTKARDNKALRDSLENIFSWRKSIFENNFSTQHRSIK